MSEGEGRSSGGTSESNMMDMVRMIMEGNRQNEMAREKVLHERQMELEEMKLKGQREAEELRIKRQEEYEAKQLEQQITLMKVQVEMAEKANKLHREGQDQDRRRSRALTGIADWKEGEDLEEFFESAERKMTAAGIGRDEWMEIIDQKLKGQALVAWQNTVARGGGYLEVKGKVLEVCG